MKFQGFKVGYYYRDVDDNDVILITQITSDRYYFDIIVDPNYVWGDSRSTYFDKDFEKSMYSDYVLDIKYKTPLYNLINC